VRRIKDYSQLSNEKPNTCLEEKKLENSRIEVIENSYKNYVKLFFEKANDIKVGFKAKSTSIKDGEGLLITDMKKAANEFKKMFNKI